MKKLGIIICEEDQTESDSRSKDSLELGGQTESDIKSKEFLALETHKEFLSVFGDNNEQKKAVISTSKRVLILAGAGSGKTLVLTKRFVHLVKNMNIHPTNIIALTFTKEAANEMRSRIAKELGCATEVLKQHVRTFHSFGLSILKMNEQFDVLNQSGQKDIIVEALLSLKDNKEVMGNLQHYIADNIVPKVKSKEAETKEPQYKNKADDFGERRILTTANICVRSKSERDIANFLTLLGIRWDYENPVDWADAPFKPDFCIDNEVYIEHWCYNDKSYEFPGINKKKYLEHRKWKEEQYKKFNKKLISIEESEMLDLVTLQDRLAGELKNYQNMLVTKKSLYELLSVEPVYKSSLENFVEELIDIINLIKSMHLTTETVKERALENGKEKVVNFYNVLIPVLEIYEHTLKTRGYSLKDFNDLIKDAVRLLKKDEKKRSYYQDKIRFVLVDEYQDVSFGDVELLKLIVTDDTHLFAVGDDWQSIYGWRGASVDYILHFDRDFGSNERIILPVNYRSPKNVIEASNYFIQLSEKQVPKQIRCCKEKQYDDSKIIQVNADNDDGAVRFIVYMVKKLIGQNPDLKISDFLVLYRSSRIMSPYRKAFRSLGTRIPQKTIHWAKGTEYKYVFVIGLKQGIFGFPNVFADKDIKRIILDIPIDDKEEEERRLFYVAMTRAKEGLFLISEAANESVYVHEIPQQYKKIIERSAK